MAIDTREKRQCAAQVGCPMPPSILPAGVIDKPARQQASYTYRGIAAAPPSTGTPPGLMMLGVGT